MNINVSFLVQSSFAYIVSSTGNALTLRSFIHLPTSIHDVAGTALGSGPVKITWSFCPHGGHFLLEWGNKRQVNK